MCIYIYTNTYTQCFIVNYIPVKMGKNCQLKYVFYHKLCNNTIQQTCFKRKRISLPAKQLKAISDTLDTSATPLNVTRSKDSVLWAPQSFMNSLSLDPGSGLTSFRQTHGHLTTCLASPQRTYLQT